MKILSRSCSVFLGVVSIIFFAVALWPQSAAHPDGREQSPEARVKSTGKPVRDDLEQDSDRRSLMQALTTARFGLQWQDHESGGNKSGGGYVGTSHEQDLNAWFAGNGMILRPIRLQEKRDRAWSTATLHLKAWGYGKQLASVPPIVSRQVKENRIDYERVSLDPKLAFRNPQLIEWYENRAEGIEQGFILEEPPMKNGEIAPTEPLRLSLAVSGDLRAKVRDEEAIELVDAKGMGALSYSKLAAQDANGRKLVARMEASADGREIALVVEDVGARYPIVIDPVIASLEQKLRGDVPQADARFGFAVAIDGNRAVVGAWREDVGPNADVGAVYVFIRSGSAWALEKRYGPSSIGGQQCGYSVAISGSRVVYGCPGTNAGAGASFTDDVVTPHFSEIIPDTRNPGDSFGASVAINGNNVVVGAPGLDINASLQNTGAVHFFKIISGGAVSSLGYGQGSGSNAQAGTAVAVAGDTVIVGAPGIGAGSADVWTISEFTSRTAILQANDGAAGDLFGQSVAISGNTAVVGAPFNGDGGNNAGAAYVFVGATNGTWSQQQKLNGSDAFTVGDFFGASHIAIQGDTIVVGAYGREPTTNLNDDNGKAYVFTRSGTAWTQQTTMVGDNGIGDNFGVGVGISGDTVIIGARGANAVGTARAGAAFVYRVPHALANISTRLRVEAGDNVLIGGFIVTGTQPKKVIVRAIGPSLPVSGALADPVLELRNSSGGLIALNDNWRSAQEAEIIATGIPPGNDLESAIVATLPANGASYTAIVRGAGGTTGIGLVEAYDLDNTVDSKLANISTRGLVQTDDNVLIAGTIVVGGVSQKVLVRAIGPSLNVAGKLADPSLELRDGNGALLEANDNWIDSPNIQAIIDTTIPPTNDLESAIVRNLAPGNYTAIVRGVNNTTGVALVEAYGLN